MAKGGARRGAGRKRKPTAQLKTEGRFRKDRHADRADEPTAEGKPTRPRTLDKEASWFWRVHVRPLIKAGVATALDQSALWQLCELWSLYRRAAEVANDDPTDKDARIAVTQYRAAWDSLASRFGLTPADRARLRVEPKAPSADAEFFGNGT